jgi:hypothetical protein
MAETSSSKPAASRAAPTAQALLALGDEAFVRCAYLTLFGREVDPSGLESYLDQMRDGVEKTGLVVQMALSDEGRQRPRTLTGLQALIDDAARVPPWPKRLARRLLRPWRETPPEPVARAFRMMDNRLARIEALLQAQATDMASVRGELAQVAISIDAARPGSATAAAPAAGGGTPGTPLPRQAPIRVEQIYRGLQRIWARRIGMNH